MNRKILCITGTRAEYGLLRPVLKAIDDHPKLELELVVTGMHLMPEFGSTVKEIQKDGFNIHKLNAIYEKDNKSSMTNFLGKFIQLLTYKVNKLKPDVILILGDRAEMLAGSIVGAYLTIPVAHLHGGEITSTVDEFARHAITKLSHIHLPATQQSAKRIEKMGEDPSNIFVVGAPGLDSILNVKTIKSDKISKKYYLDILKPILMVVQHPVTMEAEDSAEQIKLTLEAISELKHQTILTYPNADPGGRKMIQVIKKYEKLPFLKAYKNIPHEDYLGLMKIASVIIGNSSSGIIESPSLGLPAVNIGPRQDGRQRAENVIDVEYNKKQIKAAIEKAINDDKFKEKVKKCKNPYGDGKSAKRIVKVLNTIKITPQLLQKKITY